LTTKIKTFLKIIKLDKYKFKKAHTTTTTTKTNRHTFFLRFREFAPKAARSANDINVVAFVAAGCIVLSEADCCGPGFEIEPDAESQKFNGI
jgi:hypothetical protein